MSRCNYLGNELVGSGARNAVTENSLTLSLKTINSVSRKNIKTKAGGKKIKRC